MVVTIFGLLAVDCLKVGCGFIANLLGKPFTPLHEILKRYLPDRVLINQLSSIGFNAHVNLRKRQTKDRCTNAFRREKGLKNDWKRRSPARRPLQGSQVLYLDALTTNTAFDEVDRCEQIVGKIFFRSTNS